MSFENMKSETFSLQLPFLQVFLLVVFIPFSSSINKTLTSLLKERNKEQTWHES